jgi:hypothetical protein
MEHDVAQRTHPLQRLMDNPWVLLAIGVTIPFVSYSVWGWLELWMLPVATLP